MTGFTFLYILPQNAYIVISVPPEIIEDQTIRSFHLELLMTFWCVKMNKMLSEATLYKKIEN